MLPSKTSGLDLANFKSPKILSLDRILLESLAEGKLGNLTSVEVFHLTYYCFDESYDEDRRWSVILTNDVFPNLRETVFPSTPIDVDGIEAST